MFYSILPVYKLRRGLIHVARVGNFQASFATVYWLPLQYIVIIADLIAGVYFELNGKMFTNNSVISIDTIGQDDEALLCKTDKEECCIKKSDRVGEFYYPNGVQVPINKARQGFYRNRGSQLIRLNRRPGIMSPTGSYRCEIPDKNGATQNIFVNLALAQEWCSHQQ